MSEIRDILKRRDKLSDTDIDDLIESARESFDEGMDPEDILRDDFGLEPDYIFDFLELMR